MLGGGGFHSQVFLPFEEGISPFKEENNYHLCCCHAYMQCLTPFLAVSIPGHNYPEFKGPT